MNTINNLIRFLTIIVLFVIHVKSDERRVHIPPLMIDQSPREVPFTAGESIKLHCEATGKPPVKYRWEFDQRDYSESGGKATKIPGTGTLHFSSPQTKDQGVYQCFAANRAGVAMTDKTLLRQATLDTFSNELVKINRYVSPGEPLLLKCVKPSSYPNAVIFWGNRKAGSVFNQVITNDRVTYTPDGHLSFANVVKEDAFENKGYYLCNAENMVMQRVSTGPLYIVHVRNLNPILMAPRVVWVPPPTHLGVLGRTLIIKCIFSGSPTPEIKWIRYIGCDDSKAKPEDCKEQALSSRTHLTSFGQQMIIENIQHSDKGKYQCSCTNSERQTPIMRSMWVKIEEAPRWLPGKKPESINAAIGDSVTFYCKASGIPQPQYYWFIDSKSLKEMKADPNRVSDPSKNSLTFHNLAIDQQFVVQCNATNDHGNVFTNAYVNVLKESPNIEFPPLKKQKASEGQTISLRCKVFGSPRPQIIWYKGEEQLTGGRFKVLSDGDLQIADLSLVDAGKYRCYAVNNLGETSASGSLIVRRRTMIRMAPQDVMVTKGSEVKLTCTAMTDPEEASKLQINWAKNREIINYDAERRIFMNYMDNSLTISGMQIRDSGTYSCIASNGLDSDVADAMLLVQGPPDEPKYVSVVCHNEIKEATLKWEAGSENYAPILNYIIQYNTTFAPDTWVDYNTNLNQSMRQYTVKMSPYANYTFRILARNLFGMSFPSIHTSVMCTTGADVPYKNPENVMGEGDLSDNLVIFWTPMPGIEHNARLFNYIVSWRVNGSNSEFTSDTVNRADYWNLVITKDIIPYTAYEITVKARNGEGESNVPPDVVIGYSGEKSPSVAPKGIILDEESITSHTVSLSWEDVRIKYSDKINGFFRGYRIQYGKVDTWPEGVYETDVIINKPKQYPRSRIRRAAKSTRVDYVVQNLPAYSNLKLQIRVLTKYYVGPSSDALFFSTPEGQPGPLSALEIHSRGPTHCDLRWSLPTETNGRIVAYNISYQSITGLNLGRIQYRKPIEDPEIRKVKLTGLKPDTFYRVYVAASTVEGKGEDIFLDFQTTESGIPQAPTFIITAVNNSWVHILWEPSRNGNPGSIFYIQYRPRGSYDYRHTPDEVIRHDMDIYYLDPGTTYQIRIVSKNGAGQETASSWQEFTTSGTGPGVTYLWSSGWWYGMWFSLFAIVIFIVGFFFTKKHRDIWWHRHVIEIEEQIRQLQAEEAALQLGITNDYVVTGSREMINQSQFDPSRVQPGQSYNKPGPSDAYKMSQSFEDSMDQSTQRIDPALINRSINEPPTYQPNPSNTDDGVFVRGSTHHLASGEIIDQQNSSRISGDTKDDTFV